MVTAVFVTASGVGRSWDGFRAVGTVSGFQDNGKGGLMDLLGWVACSISLVDVFFHNHAARALRHYVNYITELWAGSHAIQDQGVACVMGSSG